MSPERIGWAMILAPVLLLFVTFGVLLWRSGDRARAISILIAPIVMAYFGLAMHLIILGGAS